MNYSIKYFISKFEAIPDDLWACGWSGINRKGQTCAMGHSGYDIMTGDFSDEALALMSIFSDDGDEWKRYEAVYSINDGILLPGNERIIYLTLCGMGGAALGIYTKLSVKWAILSVPICAAWAFLVFEAMRLMGFKP